MNGVDTPDAVLLSDGDVVKLGTELTLRFVYPPQMTREDLLLAEQLKGNVSALFFFLFFFSSLLHFRTS